MRPASRNRRHGRRSGGQRERRGGRVFQIMARNGHIPPPPYAELDGLRLQPEYVSPMAALQAA